MFHILPVIHQWHHVRSSKKPADLLSQGMDPSKLQQCELWFNGPNFLMENKYPNTIVPEFVIKRDTNELKNCFNHV